MEYRRAYTVDEALQLHNEAGVVSRLLAGGTDFLLSLRRREIAMERIVDITPIPELKVIAETDGEITLGANVSFADLLASPLIRSRASVLADMAAEAGAVQLRNMGTIGGNIANAALAADSLPVLIALDARAHMISPEGRRAMPIVELVTGPGKTALQPGEIITHFSFRPPVGRSTFIKVGRRNALNIARLSITAIGALEGGRMADVRLVPGAALRHTRRATEVEQMLLGEEPNPALFRQAGQAMAELMVAISGRRWSTPYKEPVIAAITERALLQVFMPERLPAVQPLAELLAHLHGETRHPVEAHPDDSVPTPHSPVRHAGPPQTLRFSLNGRPVQAEVPVGLSLLTVLRDTFGMIGAKEGCNGGECGACTVLVDGESVLACLMLAHQAEGREVITIEGVRAPTGDLNDLQEAFIDYGAVQCGICIPGMILSAEALLARTLEPTREEIRYSIAGNLCRCTGYEQIVDAIEVTAQQRRQKHSG